MPNTVAAIWRNGDAVAGSLSHNGRSSVFVSANYYDAYSHKTSHWWEGDDGFYCGFTVAPVGYQPQGFRPYIAPEALSWTCPYWLMTAAWLLAFYRTRGAFRFNLRDALAITGLTAISLGLIHLQVALVATTLLNLATAALLAWFVARSIVSALWATTRAESLRPVDV
jgi:hypothetical protein